MEQGLTRETIATIEFGDVACGVGSDRLQFPA